MHARSPFLAITAKLRRCGMAAAFALGIMGSAVAATRPVFDLSTLQTLLDDTAGSGNTIQLGDMLFKRDKLAAQRQRLQLRSQDVLAAAVRTSVTLWPEGQVPISFDPSVTEGQKGQFLAACAEWSAVAGVIFVEATNEENYVRVLSSDENSSYVGMVGGEQELRMVSWGNKYVICHELGHALGLSHEQCRSDRDTYVTIHLENVAPGQAHNFAKVTTTNDTPYDFDSVMHYGPYSFSIGNAPTIQAKPGYESAARNMGQLNHLSTYDVEGVATLYGKTPGPLAKLVYVGYTMRDGNSNGWVEPGEHVELSVRVRNDSFITLPSVSASTATSSEFLRFSKSLDTASNIQPQEEIQFSLRGDVNDSARLGTEISFYVTIESATGSFTQELVVPAGRAASLAPTTPPSQVRVSKVKKSGGMWTGKVAFVGKDSVAAVYQVESRSRANSTPWSQWKVLRRETALRGTANYLSRFRVKAADLYQFRVSAKNNFGVKSSKVVTVRPRSSKR